MRTRVGLNGDMRPAFRAEAAMHDVAAVRLALEINERTVDVNGLAREYDIHRGASRPNELAHTAPAGSRGDGLSLDRKALGTLR
jgi:hypothetical protein